VRRPARKTHQPIASSWAMPGTQGLGALTAATNEQPLPASAPTNTGPQLSQFEKAWGNRRLPPKAPVERRQKADPTDGRSGSNA